MCVCCNLHVVLLAEVAGFGAVRLPLSQRVERVGAEAVLDPCGAAVNTTDERFNK